MAGIRPSVRLNNGVTVPAGVWLAASVLFGRPVPVSQPYPCVCGTEAGCERKRNPTHCWCWGRTDNLSHLPKRCCAVRAARLSRWDRTC